MSTKVQGAGGTTTSFANSGVAVDDTFSYGEDTALGTFSLDVLAGDGGGTKRELWSVDDGDNDSGAMAGYSAADLLTRDTSRTEALSNDRSAKGATIWITSDGKVAYNAASLSAEHKASIAGLAEGESFTDTFIYAIKLANGTLSWATATVVFRGENDAPVVTSGSADLDEANGGLAASGTLSVTDADTSDTVDVTVAGVSVSGAAGALTEADLLGFFSLAQSNLAADTGSADNLGWAFDSGSEAFDYLAQGETLTLTYTVSASDGRVSSTNTVTITITGTNDAPTIAALIGEVGEDGPEYSQNLLAGAADVDSASLTVVDADETIQTAGERSLVLGTHYTVTDSVFALTEAGFALFNDLDEGESDTLVFNYSVSDGIDATANTLTVTINGSADGPVYVPPVPVPADNTSDPNNNDSLAQASVVTQTGGAANPTYVGTANADTITGGGTGNGNNTIYGGAGNDIINGDADGSSNAGNDTIYGGSGSDTINGRQGNDKIFGGDGNDVIHGNGGNDEITGGYGADELWGDAGNDTFFYLSALDTGDTIHGFNAGGNDTIDLSALAPAGGSLVWNGALDQAGILTSAYGVGFQTVGTVTTIFVDSSGDGLADLEINLQSPTSFGAADLVLAPAVI